MNLFKKSNRTQLEIEVQDYLDELGLKYILGDRTVLDDRELDFYIPELNLAIECGAIYWHSELSAKRGNNYHYEKYQGCLDKNITLITFFHDQWETLTNQIKHRIRHIAHKSTKRIYARQCVVKKINNTTAKQFTHEYHIQGHVATKLYYGLYHQDELIAVMTFGVPRYNKKYQYELVRYCAKYAIPGAASKLLKHFVNENDPESIVSYSDNCWGSGNLYQKIGFTQKKVTIGYYYTDYKNRYNRTKFQKHELLKEGYDAELTEWEIMQMKGYDRIWDCGQTTWIWHKNNNK